MMHQQRSPSLSRHRSARRKRLFEGLEPRNMLAVDISISDATVTEGNDAIRLIDVFVPERSGGLDFVSGSAFGPDGNGDGELDLYVVSARAAKVLQFDGTNGAFIKNFVTVAGGDIGDAAPLFGMDGTMYLADGRLRVYDASTGALINEVTRDGGLSTPRLDPNGVLHLRSNNSEVVRYDGAGVTVVVPEGSGGLIHVSGFDFGPDVNGDGFAELYVGSFDYNQWTSDPGKILRYDGQTGAFLDVFKSYPVGKQGGVGHFGPDGFLYSVVQTGYYSPSNPNPPLRMTRFDPLTGAEIDSSPWQNGPFDFGPDGLIYRSGWTHGNVVDRYGPTSLAVFTVSLSSPSTAPVTVNYATTSGSATVGSDYEPVSGSLTFAPGQTKLSVLVKTLNDTAVELSETFTVNLTGAVGGAVVDGQGVGTIHDNVGSRSISIGDATAIEGSTAIKYLDRFVSAGSGGLARPRGSVIGPDSNFDGVPELFVASADTNEILRYDGRTGEFISVLVSAGSGGLNSPIDLKFGRDGNLYVSSFASNQVLRYNGSTGAFIDVVASGLSGPVGLTVGGDGSLFIASQDSDEVLRYNASGKSVFIAAGSGGLDQPRNAVFGPDGNGDGRQDLYVSSQGTREVLRYDGVTGTFVDKFATTSLGAGPIWIGFGGDNRLYATVRTNPNANETSILRFDANNGAFVDRFDLARDGWSFTLGPDNFVYNSGNGSGNFVDRYGPASFVAFTVSLSAASSTPVTVNYSTANGSAVAGNDYQADSRSLTFLPGQTTKTIVLRTWNDAAAEPSETFTINLSGAVGALIADGQAAATIQDDDSAGPTISINDVTVTEDIDARATFTVRLSRSLASPVTVAYVTSDMTATAGIDYSATSGTLTFAPGETLKSVQVPILNDPVFELADETFTLNLANATGAEIADAEAIATIEDSDFPPWTVRASIDGRSMEVYLGNPPLHDDPLVWPMDAKVPFPFDLDSGDEVIIVELPPASEGPDGGIEFLAGAGLNELHIKSGNVRVDSTAVGGRLKTVVSEGAGLITARLEQSEVLIDGRLTLLSGGETSRVTELSLGPEGVLDLNDNALVVDYTGASPLAAIREKILSGRGGAGFGASWTGAGINSSAAAQANTVDPESRSLAYAENATLPLGPYTTFRGQPVDATSVLIAYTRTGDANLDGLVNDDDVTIVGAAYAPGVPQPSWALGDFDYNGFVDDDDITLLGVFYNPSAVGQAPPASAVARSPDCATRPTEGLQIARQSIETFGQVSVRGQETRAPHVIAPLAEREVYIDYSLAIQQLLADNDAAFAVKRKRLQTLAAI
jgi:hypothetical protein